MPQFVNYCVDFPVIAPEQVTGVGVTLDNTNNALKLTITWDRPYSEQPVTHYFVRFDKTRLATKVVGVTTLTITGTPGRNYTFSVIAVSAVGFGKWSRDITAGHKYNNNIIQKSVSHLTMHIKVDGV